MKNGLKSIFKIFNLVALETKQIVTLVGGKQSSTATVTMALTMAADVYVNSYYNNKGALFKNCQINPYFRFTNFDY